eukprot:COSAG05_NODE_8367_length_710_cov_1.162029_1_plen_158_part_00
MQGVTSMSRLLAESELAKQKSSGNLTPESKNLASRAKRIQLRSRINDAEATRKIPSPLPRTPDTASHRTRLSPGEQRPRPQQWVGGDMQLAPQQLGFRGPVHQPLAFSRPPPDAATQRLSASEFVDKLRRMRGDGSTARSAIFSHAAGSASVQHRQA